MSPIKDLSDSVRLPRIGKIRLGTRDPERGFPRKSDHFILPLDHSDYKKMVELYGETPKELRILIPVEEDEVWCTQYYRAYNLTYGLICKGDGETAMRMVDVKTGQLPDAKKPSTVALREQPCPGPDCPDYQAKKCHEVMNLRFILPEVPGLGVWQIDTGSKNSILNINSCAKVIKRAFGRVSMIPLKLTFEPIQVNNPETDKKQTVYVLNLRTDVTLAQLADAAREQSKMFLLEAPSLEDAFDVEVEKDIEKLWGEQKEDIQPTPKPELKPKATNEQPKKSQQAPPKPTESLVQPAPEKQGTRGEYAESPAYAAEKERERGKAIVDTLLSKIVEPEQEASPFDADWLKETLKIIHWTEVTVKSWIKAQFKVPVEGTLVEVLKSLERDNLEAFFNHIRLMRESAGE